MSEELRQEVFGLVAQDEEQWVRTDALLIRDHVGYRIMPHPDTHLKSVTAQIYLPKTRLRPHLGTSLHDIQVFCADSCWPLMSKFFNFPLCVGLFCAPTTYRECIIKIEHDACMRVVCATLFFDIRPHVCADAGARGYCFDAGRQTFPL